MNFRKFLILLWASVSFTSAHPGHAWDPDGPLEINIAHPAFSVKDGMLYLGSKPYTGVVVEEIECLNKKLVESDIPNSILARRFSYKEGVRHGESHEWYPNGFLKALNYYAKGVFSGIQQTWHENGRPASKKDYIMGALYGLEQHWDKEGNLIKELVHDPIPDDSVETEIPQ